MIVLLNKGMIFFGRKIIYYSEAVVDNDIYGRYIYGEMTEVFISLGLYSIKLKYILGSCLYKLFIKDKEYFKNIGEYVVDINNIRYLFLIEL